MLNSSDIQLLMDALEALKKQKSKDSFVTGMIGAILIEDQKESKDFFEQMQLDGKDEQQLLEERIILTQAKLIQMKDAVMVSEVFGQ